MTEWLPKWQNGCQNDRMTTKMTEWLPKWQNDCQNDRMTAKMTEWLPKWQNDCSIVIMTDTPWKTIKRCHLIHWIIMEGLQGFGQRVSLGSGWKATLNSVRSAAPTGRPTNPVKVKAKPAKEVNPKTFQKSKQAKPKKANRKRIRKLNLPF